MHGYYGDFCDLKYDDYYQTPCDGHAHRDEAGKCCCDQYWEGDDCSIYVYYEYDTYQGPCDPICDGCTGSDPTECEKCNHNAYWDSTGKCVCKEYWEGDDCSIWNYTGPCDDKCDECVGPEATECIRCNSKSVFNN